MLLLKVYFLKLFCEIKVFIVDVDGVMTDGGFYYSKNGKFMKKFGPDDADMIRRAKSFLKIVFVSADKRGFEITKKRISKDLNCELHLLSPTQRISWIEKRYDFKNVAYMGDSFTDLDLFKLCRVTFAPSNAWHECRQRASFSLREEGGNRAVARALTILHKIIQ
jgi:3-deoxy-D-manno-octulosonate 8-phosphate phosphatase (KDO 8-P phosphatase)